MTGTLTTVGQSKKDSVLPKVDSLKAVIVRPKEIRPRLHSDTTEYNTAGIQMRVNANVEELLGRLPGLHIDANGVITYNGEVIKQLLVDGEDLFGSDPTIVTRNFDASRISRVQLLDRKSDQARFTGVDDGNRTKTLNLILKEDSKKGYFGKVEAGADAQGTYNANGLLGSFQRREQIAALGLASNTGTTALSNNTGGTFSSIFAMNVNDDPLGTSAGQGIPRFRAMALHYANTWDGTDNHLVGNYQYSNLLTRPVTTSSTLQTLPDSVYAQSKRAQSVNQQDQHWGYGTYEWAVDSHSAFRSSFHYSNTNTNNQYNDTSLGTFNGITVNRNSRTAQSVGNRNNIGGGISWRIQSQKKIGRIFSVGTGFTRINTSTDGYLYSLNQFYQPDGELESRDTVNQRKQITNRTMEFNGDLSYAEPLWGKNVLGFYYGIFYIANQSRQSTFNRGDGKYQEFVDSLSSHLNGHTMSQTSSIVIQGNDRQFGYVLTAGMQWYSYGQRDILADSSLRYHYLNFTPHLLVYYTPNSTTRLNFDYASSTQQPSLTQLQPIKNNNDPLHIFLGNPNLRPGTNQSWKVMLTSSKTWLYYLSLDFGLNSNSISTKTLTDSLGRQISQPVNVDGGQNWGLNFSINKKIRGIDIGMMGSLAYSRNVNYINTDLSQNDSYTSYGGFKIEQYVANRYSFQLDTKFTYFDNHSSINTSAPVHYWSQSHTGILSLFFIPGIELTTNANYTWQQVNSAFAKSTSVLLWNASIGHNFLSSRLALKLLANNLLNQNSGISRTNLGNVNTESSTNILGRYWLLSLAYRFDHKYKRK
jgi:hypothetical protein